MKARRFTILALTLTVGLTGVLNGCGPASEAGTVPVGAAPAESVEAFYTWYLDYFGDRAAGEMRNPLADGAYRSTGRLSEDFVREIDETIGSFDRGGYDPFLCAQDIPDRITVGEATVSGDRAVVPVQSSFEGHSFTVVLRPAGGEWQIAGVDCGAPVGAEPVAAEPATTPSEVVESFYDWYLWYAWEVGNPLADRAYRSSEYLTAGFVLETDDLIASFDRGGYDPFLCAQDIPEAITIRETTLLPTGRATCIVESTFAGHSFMVDLERIGGRWAISRITCGGAA